MELTSIECGVAITMPGPPVYEPVATVVNGETLTNHRSRVLKDGVTYGFICTPAQGLGKGQLSRNYSTPRDRDFLAAIRS